MKVKISENIRKFRKEHALTQEQLAEALGVTVGAVYKWEAGLSMPEIKLLMELADLFEVSVDVLLGYEQQSKTLDALASRIEALRDAREFEEAVSEVQKALKKYPNNFKVVYQSAILYQVKYLDNREERDRDKSTELFHRAISLLYQNTDSNISEVTILNSVADNYLMAGEIEQALEILKKNNVCGVNNARIGLTYANGLEMPKEAKTYLIEAFEASLKNILNATIGLSGAYHRLNQNDRAMKALVWLNDFIDCIKTEKENITYADRLKAVIMIQCAYLETCEHNYQNAAEYTKHAYTIAKKFDASPVYNLHGIIFCEEEDETGVAFDDLGKTAMEAVERVAYAEDSEAYLYIRKILGELKNEKDVCETVL